jgi:hypothetical protein
VSGWLASAPGEVCWLGREDLPRQRVIELGAARKCRTDSASALNSACLLVEHWPLERLPRDLPLSVIDRQVVLLTYHQQSQHADENHSHHETGQ